MPVEVQGSVARLPYAFIEVDETLVQAVGAPNCSADSWYGDTAFVEYESWTPSASGSLVVPRPDQSTPAGQSCEFYIFPGGTIGVDYPSLGAEGAGLSELSYSGQTFEVEAGVEYTLAFICWDADDYAGQEVGVGEAQAIFGAPVSPYNLIEGHAYRLLGGEDGPELEEIHEGEATGTRAYAPAPGSSATQYASALTPLATAREGGQALTPGLAENYGVNAAYGGRATANGATALGWAGGAGRSGELHYEGVFNTRWSRVPVGTSTVMGFATQNLYLGGSEVLWLLPGHLTFVRGKVVCVSASLAKAWLVDACFAVPASGASVRTVYSNVQAIGGDAGAAGWSLAWGASQAMTIPTTYHAEHLRGVATRYIPIVGSGLGTTPVKWNGFLDIAEEALPA